MSLPVLDLASPTAGGSVRQDFLAGLRDAMHHHGAFYLTGHGVDPSLIAQVQAAARAFFALPMEEKLRIEMVRSPHFRGYNRAGQELTRGEQDWREQLDINVEEEPFAMGPDTPAWRRLQGPNQWPPAMPELRSILLAYQREATRVGIALLEAIAAALEQPEKVFVDIYQPQPSQLMKIIRYPGREAAQSNQGVGAHRDNGFVTVLLQDEVAGLRVRSESGDWVEVPPMPGSFVINTGEVLEMATNDFVRAVIHEVLAPPAGIERHSIALFLGARADAVVPVIDLPPHLNQRGLSVDPLNPIFREVGVNQLKSRLRSHPDVARVHYGDV